MNIVGLFGHVPPEIWIGWLIANVVPYLSALVTRAPNWIAGFLTLLLSAVDGFLSQWAAAGNNFDWKAALGSTLVAWVIAILHHSKILQSTDTEAALHNMGPQLGKPAVTVPPDAR